MKNKGKSVARVLAIVLALVMVLGVVIPAVASADEPVEPELLDKNVINVRGTDGKALEGVGVDFALAKIVETTKKADEDPKHTYGYLQDKDGETIILASQKTNELGQVALEDVLSEDKSQILVSNNKLVGIVARAMSASEITQAVKAAGLVDEKAELEGYNYLVAMPREKDVVDKLARYDQAKNMVFELDKLKTDEYNSADFEFYNETIAIKAEAYTKEPTGVNNEIELIKDGEFVLTENGKASLIVDTEKIESGAKNFRIFRDQLKLKEIDEEYILESNLGLKQVKTADGYKTYGENIDLAGPITVVKTKATKDKPAHTNYYLANTEDLRVELVFEDKEVKEIVNGKERTRTEKVIKEILVTTFNSKEEPEPEKPVERKAERLAGPNRYSTAVEISKAGFESANTVILASGENTADALAAGPLAKQYNGPILLTGKTLPVETEREIQRLGAKNILAVGGEKWIPAELVTKLERQGYEVERIAGANRYDTSVEIAKKTNADRVVLANGINSVDALALAPYANKFRYAILLTDSNKLSEKTENYIRSHISAVEIVGGYNSVSKEIENSLGSKFQDRVEGDNRFETATALAYKTMGLNTKNVILVNSDKGLVDALASAGLANMTESVILLSGQSYLDKQSKAFMRTNDIENVRLIGGLNSLSMDIYKEVEGLLELK